MNPCKHSSSCTMVNTVVVLSSCILLSLAYGNGPVRKTKFGNVYGRVSSRYSGTDVEEFLGVPYAEPPVKSLRYKRPQDPSPWKHVKTTTALPPACPQLDWYYINSNRPNFKDSSEDCLYMNLYVPKVPEKNLSVLLFIHGGSNRVGMGNMMDGDILAAFGHIIVVNFNYRLGVLGFYADRSENIEGNLGLLDQVHAMKWVQENIHYFNGDPTKVTIYGHSAGAGDVGLHLVSDLTKDMFRYSVVHSGSPLAFWGVSPCVPTFWNPDIPNDCKPGSSYVEHNKSYSEMMESSVSNYSFLAISGEGEGLPLSVVTFSPVIDGYYLKESPSKSFQCERPHGESVLLAMAKDEGFPEYKDKDRTFLENKDSFEFYIDAAADYYQKSVNEDDLYEWFRNVNSSSTLPQWMQVVADNIFYVPMLKLADLISMWMDDVYLLSFEYLSQNITGPDWQGVPHGWDMFYVFGIPLVGHAKHDYTERDIEASKVTMKLISNYVKFGFLTLDGKTNVGIYDGGKKSYHKLHYDGNNTIITPEVDFRKERIDFWYKYMFSNTFPCNDATPIIYKNHFITVLLVIKLLIDIFQPRFMS